jgi:hypothetical protein
MGYAKNCLIVEFQHTQTAGMTCYRWSREGLMRRSGRDWYFVPEAERQSKRVNGHTFGASEPMKQTVICSGFDHLQEGHLQ